MDHPFFMTIQHTDVHALKFSMISSSNLCLDYHPVSVKPSLISSLSYPMTKFKVQPLELYHLLLTKS